MLRITEDLLIKETHIEEISAYYAYMSVMDIQHGYDENDKPIRSLVYSYKVGAKLKMSSGKEHFIYNVVQMPDNCVETVEKITNDAQSYAIDIAKLIFPNEAVRRVGIGKS